MVLQSVGRAGPLSKQWLMIAFENNTTKDSCRETLQWANSAFHMLTLKHPTYTVIKERKITCGQTHMFLATAAVTIKLPHLYQKHFCHTCKTTSFLNFFWLSSASSRPRCINNGVLFTHHIALQFCELKKERKKERLFGKSSNILCAYPSYSLQNDLFLSQTSQGPSALMLNGTNSKWCFSLSTTEKADPVLELPLMTWNHL